MNEDKEEKKSRKNDKKSTKKSQIRQKDREKSTVLTSILGRETNENEINEISNENDIAPDFAEASCSHSDASASAPDPSDVPLPQERFLLSGTFQFPTLQDLQSAFKQEEAKYRATESFTLTRSKTMTMTDTDTEELADLSPDIGSYESAALLLIKGGHDRFRSLSVFEWKALQLAFCFMFQCGVTMTLRRLSEFLIFLLPEARNRSEEDVQQGERLTQLHGKLQQTAVVLVESLREADQEMLWCSSEGLTILMLLQLGDARLFFARPTLQHIMCDLWRGVRPESYSRSLWKQLQVWMRLLLYSGPNLVILIFWAAAPALEEWLRELSIRIADKGRQDEASYWEQKRLERENKKPQSGDFGSKVKVKAAKISKIEAVG